MKVGLFFVNAGPPAFPGYATELVQAAEEGGMDSLWTVQHVVVPADHSTPYPYDESGKMPIPDDTDIADPLLWLAHVAGKTSTIRLCTGVLLLAQRNPLLTAKELATLDVLSGGRVTVGIGSGWLKEEFDAMGVPFEDRGARVEEYLAAMRALWTGEAASFDGKFVSFDRVYCRPVPVQEHIPVVIGGHSHAAARRAGRLGDGFFPAVVDMDRLAAVLESLRTAAEDAGRDPSAIEVTCPVVPTPDAVARVQTMVDLGVTRVVIPAQICNPESVRVFVEMFGGD